MTLLGQISLSLWAVVAMALFARLSARVAIAVTIIGGYLLLPTRAELDLPLLPALNKDTVPVLMAILLLAVTASDRTGVRPGVVPRHWLALVLMVVMVVGAFGTVMTNGDLLQYGPTVLRALRPYDAFSEVLTVVMLLLPMLIGRKYFARPEDHQLLLQVLMVAGLGYSLLALYEIRMSPQLNRMFYGYFPHSWTQHIRGDGFRPLVFLNHGLWLSLFLSGTTLAAAGLWRSETDPTRKRLYLLALVWLFGTLFLSKSLGAFLVTVVLVPLILIGSIRLQLLAAASIAAVVLTFPLLRSADMVPAYDILDVVGENISADRAESFRFRLENEDILLDKARERYVFGWGGWARNRVFDPETGDDVSVTDGAWVIELGTGGLVGYFTTFGLLIFGPVLIWIRRRALEIDRTTAALFVILAGNLIDLIPNAGLTVVTWLFAGALWGRLELGRAEVPKAEERRGGERLPDDLPPLSGPCPVRPSFANKGTGKLGPGPVYTRQLGPTYRRTGKFPG